MRVNGWVCLLSAFAISLAIGSSVLAQVTTTGRIVGTVRDASQSPVPGAELRLENQGTKGAQFATSAADGGFVFPSVTPGVYDLTVTMKGFETAVYKGIVVNAAQTTDQPLSLKVGALNQTVEV